MVWGKLVFSFSDWSNLTSADGELWTDSEGGSPSGSSAPPTSPSPLVSGACGLGRLVRRVSSIARFSLRSPPPYMGLGWGVSPPLDPCWHGMFCSGYFTRGPGSNEDSSGLCSILCDSLDFFVVDCWTVIEFLGPFVPVPPS